MSTPLSYVIEEEDNRMWITSEEGGLVWVDKEVEDDWMQLLLDDDEDDDDQEFEEDSIAPPQTPEVESDLVSESWSLSAFELTRALLAESKTTTFSSVTDEAFAAIVSSAAAAADLPCFHHPYRFTPMDTITTSSGGNIKEEEEFLWSTEYATGDVDDQYEGDGSSDDGRKKITPPPQTPDEPMEFLCQSRNLSASEITKALLSNLKTNQTIQRIPPHVETTTMVTSNTCSSYPFYPCNSAVSSEGGLSWSDNIGMEVIKEEEEEEEEEEEDDNNDESSFVPPVLPPQTPQEPMEFLARSWRLSTSEITKALLSDNGGKKFVRWNPDTAAIPTRSNVDIYDNGKPSAADAAYGTESNKRWFRQTGKPRKRKPTKKEIARADQANIHAAVSVAGVAAAVAAMAATANSERVVSKMSLAMASATELLATHLTEIAEMTGADKKQVAAAVLSAVDVRTAGDLMTLTAAAATALRGAAALNIRVMRRESRSNASVTPIDKDNLTSPNIFFCKEGHLLKRTKSGALHWKEVSVYINKRMQVMAKLKSRNAGDTFTKKKKFVVLGVCDDVPARSRGAARKDRDNGCFGLRTAKGLIEFECRNDIQKQKWVGAVRNLLGQVSCHGSPVENSLEVPRSC